MHHERIGEAAHATARLGRITEIALERAGLSLPQYRLLVLLTDGSSVATALAERLTVSRPSITALVDGLVQRGLVERTPDPADRRRVTHTLTPAGRATLDRGDAEVQASLVRIVDHLPARQARAAVVGLAVWIDALDAARARRAAERS